MPSSSGLQLPRVPTASIYQQGSLRVLAMEELQWLSPQQVERRFPSAAEALEYLRTGKCKYGDPNSPIAANFD